jgi:CSLREA domain-containing protein
MSAVGGAVTGTCVGTTPNTLSANATALSFTGITIPGSGNCTVIFDVKSSTPGVNPNSTSGVTATETPTGGAASNTANLTVFAPPQVVSITRVNPNPTNLAQVDFTVTFSKAVTGVNAADFTVTTTGGIVLIPSPITNVTPAGPSATYTVTVDTGTGDGTLRLNVIDDDSIQSTEAVVIPLGGTGAGNGNFTTGEVYTISKSNPFVTSITRVEANPTNLATVNFNVVFSKSVTGVNIGAGSDFVLVDGTNSITGEAITGLSGSGANYTVTVNTGTGNGTLGLNVVDDDSIIDSSSRPLGGAGLVNGDFTGDIFTVDKTAPTVTIAKASDQADPATGPTATTSIRFKAVFSEAVSGLIASDIDITGTAGATLATITEVAPDYPANTQPLNGTTYEVSVSGMTQSGSVIVQVKANAAQDAAGNNSAISGTATVNFNADNATSFEVNTVADTTDGSCDPLGTGTGNQDCTLREAILRANADFGTETITFNSTVFAVPGPYTINLTGVLPVLSTDMTIAGPGAKVLTVRRNTGGDYRVFEISGGGNPSVTIDGLRISNGNVVGISPASQGAGIFVSTTGTVNITNSTISGNTASGGGGGIFQSSGTLNITNTTVSGNSATQGGALDAMGGTANITNSTLSGNSVSGNGGGVIVSNTNVTITHTTITANVADNDNNSVGIGGGIFRNSGTVTLRNTIVARNLNGNEKQVETATVAGTIDAAGAGNARVTVTAIGMANTPKTLLVAVANNDTASDVAGKMRTALAANSDVSGFFTVSGAGANIVLTALTARATDTTLNIATDNDTSTGLTPAPTSVDTTAGATADDLAGTMEATSSFNLIGAGGAGGLVNGTNDNQVGVTDPGLFPLADNGGSTFTHALQCVSAAIDKGSAFSVFNDQRGGTRPLDLSDTVYPNASSPGGPAADGSDIGAFEVQTGGGCLPLAVPPAVDPTVTNEDTAVVITLTGTYAQNTPLTFTITDQPDHGGALTPSAANCTFTTFQTCTSTVTYTPTGDYHGPDAFKFRVSAGGLNSDEADVNITVNAVNDPPVPQNDTLTNVIMNSGQRAIPFADLLGNDSPGPADESGQSLTITGVSNPAGGTVTLDIPNSQVLFTPTNNFFGPAGFRYTLQDNGVPAATGAIQGIVGFTIISPPLIEKNFSDTTVDMNVETVSLTFKVTNPNNGTVLNGIGFIDNLPGGLEVATPNGLSGTCGGGTITAADGSTQISLAGATLNANVFCTFSVNIRGTSIGLKTNLTDAVTSTEGGSGGTATASVTVLAPDMTITKTHSGSFLQGQSETYTIIVTNSGNAATTAAVTVTDVLPIGLTPTAPSGVVNGWSCNINAQTVTCTRSDVLAAGASYPAITVTVSVADPAPLTVINTATVAGGGEQTTSNNSASDMTSINCNQDFSLNNTNPLMISRFRMNGPAGPQDEFVEIYNPGSTPHTVASGNCAGGGYGVYASAGNGTSSNSSPLVCYIPNGTVIPAGGYYLCTGATYSLGNLGRNGGVEGATSVSDSPIGCGGGCVNDIPNDAGLALLNVAQGITLLPGSFDGGVPAAGFIAYDSVGFGPYGAGAPSSGYPSLAGNFCEGSACLQPVGDASTGAICTNPTGLYPVFPAAPACYGLAGQYEFLRRQTTFDANLGTVHQDTNNSGNDWILVAPNASGNMGLAVTGISGVTAVHGAAGPQGSTAPGDTPSTSLKQAPFDGTNQLGPRNAERNFSPDFTVVDPANNPLGTFSLRLRFTNNSGSDISGLRFRVENVSTLCGSQNGSPTVGSGNAKNVAASPDCGTGSLTAILKLLNSAQEVVVDSTSTPQTVHGTVMEDLSASATPTPPGAGPLSPAGGGVDSSLVVNPSSAPASVGDGVTGGSGIFATAISTTDPDKVIRVKIKFGVVRGGRFVLLITPMTTPAP